MVQELIPHGDVQHLVNDLTQGSPLSLCRGLTES